MIPVPELTLDNQPGLFELNCREPGNTWLAEATNADKDPHEKSEWWSQFKPDLEAHFSGRCGWLATSLVGEGIVEHYLSCGPRKDENQNSVPSPHRHLAFEWTNYRYASGRVNSRKGNHDDAILDPCKVEEGWFEITLHGFQLLMTDAIPDEHRAKAVFTLSELKLRDGHDARRARWNWYERYWNGGTPYLDLLERDAPLVAAAVRKAQANGEELPDPTECAPGSAVVARKHPYKPRTKTAAAAVQPTIL
jgi:hypothetical protein